MFMAVGLPGLAADVTGNWNGKVSTPKGDFPIAFSFKANGSKLEGTMLGTDGASFPIDEGKIEGDKLTFSVTLNYPGKSLQRTYKGALNGDEIHFTVDASGQVSEFTVKRAK